ncbi:hypothetical protein H4S08_003786 [Coemansia sp. RSA 1365]|nr:hypothetical protein H4S08_003786 [Coemansia sp. RSA 1365]
MVDGYISDTYNDQIIEVYSMAAQNMASIIPNIRTVDFDFDFMDNFMKYFVAFLVSNYGQQLNDFVSRGISDFKHYPPFTSLINLNIWAGSVEATQLPQVCAKPLTTVIISTECEQFEWDMFYTDNISDTVSFDNLELLDITSNFILPEEDIQLPLDSTNISQKKLSFPLLKLLRLSGVSLKTEDIQSLLQSPLKELYCSGYPSQVLVDICGQILNNLESITLEVDDRIGKNTSLNSITNMNKIFASLHGVDKVCVIIKLPLFDHKLSSMFWPNLTHLELIANVEFEYIIQAISHMPDLVDMRIEILAVLPGFSERQMDFLDNLKQYYSKPSSSALQTLKVYGGFTDSSPRLVSAFDMLKWYFPNLVTIEFDQKADIQTW